MELGGSFSSATPCGGGITGVHVTSAVRDRAIELAAATRLPIEVVRAHTNPIDVRLFSTRAVVDWVALRIKTSEPRRFETIQGVIRESFRMEKDANPYVCVVDPGTGNPFVGTHFAVKLQDIGSAAELRRFVADLRKEVGLAQEPTVIRLEVAIDFRSKKCDLDQLRAMTLQLMLAHGMVHHSERQAWAKGARWVDQLNVLSPNDTWLSGHDEPDGLKAYVNRLDPMARAYLKTTDKGRRPIVKRRDFRARVEVRVDAVDLFGEEVPTDRLDSLDLKKFMAHLRTWRLTDHWLQSEPPSERQGVRALIWSRIQRSVLAKGHRRASLLPRPRRLHPDGVAPHKELNDRIRWALRDLNIRFFLEPAEKRRKPSR